MSPSAFQLSMSSVKLVLRVMSPLTFQFSMSSVCVLTQYYVFNRIEKKFNNQTISSTEVGA